IDAGAKAREALVRAFEETFALSSEVLRSAVPVRIGNWVGGDRDRHHFVTPDVTIATARRGSYSILGRYGAALKDLVERLSVSAQLAPPSEELRDSLEVGRRLVHDVWEANRRRNADEPVRLKLSFMQGRVEATRRLTAARAAGKYEEEQGSNPP